MKRPLYIRSYKLRNNNMLRSTDPRLLITDRPVYVIVWKDDYTESGYDNLNLPSNYSFIFQTTDRKYSVQETTYQFNQLMKDKDEFIYFMDDDLSASYIVSKRGNRLQDVLSELDDYLDENENKDDVDHLLSVQADWRTDEGTTRNLVRGFYIINFGQLSKRGIFFDRDTKVAEDADISMHYQQVYGRLPLIFRDKYLGFRINEKSLASPEYRIHSCEILYNRYKNLPISFTLFLDNKDNCWVLKPCNKTYKSSPYFDTLDKAKEYVKTKPSKYGRQKAYVNFI